MKISESTDTLALILEIHGYFSSYKELIKKTFSKLSSQNRTGTWFREIDTRVTAFY